MILYCSQEQLRREAEEDAIFRDQLEQERRDHELALRLAEETNGQVEDLSPPMRRYIINFCILFFYIYWCISVCDCTLDVIFLRNVFCWRVSCVIYYF